MIPGTPIAEEEGELRSKNQITVPKRIVDALGLLPGDRLVFVVRKEEPDKVHLYRMPRSFAGIAPDAYGGPRAGSTFVRAEREAWEE